MTFRRGVILFSWLGLLSACVSAASTPVNTPTPPLAKELVLYNWADYMPQTVLDAFTAEYGVKITYLPYESQEEAVAQIEAGQTYDVAVVENDQVPTLIARHLLAEIDQRHVPNFKNIGDNFRGLIFDPDDRYSVPYSWGTTGLLVRTDLIGAPVTRWADLWNPRFAGKIALRAQPTELISVALKSLGYALNSENPAELEAALKRLLELKAVSRFVDVEPESAVAPLVSGEAVILIGWPGDALVARRQNPAIHYLLPAEGSMLWGDRLVISASSPNRYTAELFLNFLLRPDIGGQIVNENRYAIANEAARAFIDPEILNDPVIYPPHAILASTDWYVPLSPAGQKLYDEAWARFREAGQ